MDAHLLVELPLSEQTMTFFGYCLWIILSKPWMITAKIHMMFANIYTGASNWYLPWNTADALCLPGVDRTLLASDRFLSGFGTLCCVYGHNLSAKANSFQPHWILGSAFRAYYTSCVISALSMLNNVYAPCATIDLDHGSVGWIGSNCVSCHCLN